MTKEKRRIESRIVELEQVKSNMRGKLSQKRVELANKEAEMQVIQDVINANIFENTPESRELEELKVALKWINTYEDRAEEEEEEEEIPLTPLEPAEPVEEDNNKEEEEAEEGDNEPEETEEEG